MPLRRTFVISLLCVTLLPLPGYSHDGEHDLHMPEGLSAGYVEKSSDVSLYFSPFQVTPTTASAYAIMLCALHGDLNTYPDILPLPTPVGNSVYTWRVACP